MTWARGHRSSYAAYLAVLLVACSQASPTVSTEPLVFVAYASDFDGFRKWQSFFLKNDVAPGDDHLNGPRHVFLNHRPPPGSHEFPVGTIIVKESDDEPTLERHVFAMVKRGGHYDPTGAVNWEWFQLVNQPDGSEGIVWRGAGPAGGGAYGPGPLGACNACHEAASDTDFVLTAPLEKMIGGT